MTALADLIDITRSKISIDPNGTKFDNTLIQQALSQGLQAIQRKTNYGFLENRTVEGSLTPIGVETPVPADFIAFAQPTVIKWGPTQELKLVDYNEVRRMQEVTNEGSPSFAYLRYDGTQFVIGIQPVDTSKTLSFTYVRSIGDASAGNPYPDDFDEPLTNYAAYYCLRDVRNFENKAGMWKSEFEETLREVSSTRLAQDTAALRFSSPPRRNLSRWNG